MSKLKLDYACFLNSSGFSFAAQNYIQALHNKGKYDIKIEILGSGKPARPSISDDKYEFFMKMKNKQDNANRISIYHCIPTLQKKVKAKNSRSIGFATFETFEPPSSWIDILNKNDAIIAPSKFNYEIFANAGIKKPIFHIPHCLNMDYYNRDISKMFNYDKFTFLFMGTWRKRKGYQQLVEAWLLEFGESDNVQLVIKTDKIREARRYVDKVKKQMGISKGFSQILFENKVFDAENLPNYMKSFDCLISSTMGDGFNIPGLQSMALGVPVIITNFSGCLDYVNKDRATMLEPEGFIFKKNMDNIPQFRNKKWAFVSVNKIRKAMRYVINNRDKIRNKTNNAYKFVRNNFSYEVSEKLFREMLGSLGYG